jgi:ParB family chromosome partitioning protein
VSNLLRLNQLDDSVKRLVETRKLDMGHARALLMLEGEQQVDVAEQVAKKQLTVRQTEQLVKRELAPKSTKVKPVVTNNALHLSERLGQILQAKVAVELSQQGKGKITIDVKDEVELENLLQSLTQQLQA